MVQDETTLLGSCWVFPRSIREVSRAFMVKTVAARPKNLSWCLANLSRLIANELALQAYRRSAASQIGVYSVYVAAIDQHKIGL